jgi:hypothetical protein
MTTTGGAGRREGDAVGGVVGRCRAVSAVGRFGRAGAAFSSSAGPVFFEAIRQSTDDGEDEHGDHIDELAAATVGLSQR